MLTRHFLKNNNYLLKVTKFVLHPLMASFFNLPNSDQTRWSSIKLDFTTTRLTSLEDVKHLISKCARESETQLGGFESLDHLANHVYMNEQHELISLIDLVVKKAAKLDIVFPDGKLPRLSRQTSKIELSREQILCILANMFLCTIKKSAKNPYWVTFANWIADGRTCALVYLRTLIEFFKQSLMLSCNKEENTDHGNLIFERRHLDKTRLDAYLNSHESTFKNISFDLKEESIGDKSQIEVDFANMDIGFGVTGTQEEILFGKHPELCVAMLFSDTMQDDEAIVIRNCRKVAVYQG